MAASGPDQAAGAPRWGVVLLAREPAVLVLMHLAWHLAAGAAERFADRGLAVA